MKQNKIIFLSILMFNYIHADQVHPHKSLLGRAYYESLQTNVGTPIAVKEEKPIGREYYESLVNEIKERKWAVPILFHYNFADRAFDNESRGTNLSNLIFGLCKNKIQVKDIFLLSKLADERKMHIDLVPMDADLVVQPLPLPAVRPAGSTVPFGNYRSDQYVALLSDVEICFDAERREGGVDIGGMYRSQLGSSRTVGVIGINFPIKTVLHILDFKLIGGELFNEAFTPDLIARENTLNEFFNDFSSIEDFFERAVLDPKGLKLECRQRKTGLGDIVLFGQFDFANYVEWADGLELGVNFILPTGGKEDANIVWEPVLGNGGAFQVDLYFNVLFHSSSQYFNPQITIVGELSAAYNNCRRIPKIKEQTETLQVAENPELLAPIFCEYFIDPFSECDSSVFYFADQAVKASTRIGPKFLITVGNYFYDVFNIGFRLGIFYQYLHKAKDTVKVLSSDCAAFTKDCNCGVALVEKRTNAQAHTIGWNLSYMVKNRVEINIGSQHIIAGKNVPRTHEVFASLIVVF